MNFDVCIHSGKHSAGQEIKHCKDNKALCIYGSYIFLMEENGEDILNLLGRFQAYVFLLFEAYYRNFKKESVEWEAVFES